MNARTTDVSWDPTLVRVEYLDEAGTPYYCCFNTRDQPLVPGNSPCSSNPADPPRVEPAESQVGGPVVVIIAVVLEKGVEGKGRGPSAGLGPGGVKPANTRGINPNLSP